VSCTVQFEPSGTAVEIEPGRTLLEAARDAGIPLAAACGGRGTCGKCRVRIPGGPPSSVTDHEKKALTEALRAGGWRLACQYVVTSAVTAETLLIRDSAKVEMPFTGRSFTPAPPMAGPRGARSIGLRPKRGARAPLGCAVDLGTTNIALYLYRMDDGELLGAFGAGNPLSSWGADIITRLAHGARSPENGRELQRVLVKAVNLMAGHAATAHGGTSEDIEEMVVVGNSGMHHLFLDLPGGQLIRAPYVPAVREAMSVTARDLGVSMGRDGRVYMPPLVGGFVGSDLLAVALSTRMEGRPGIRLAIDIGTNTEVLLSVDGMLHCCSTASGPALEGAALRYGSLAEPGAIERMWIDDATGGLSYETVENRPVIGICGSGIIDALSCLRRRGEISRTGVLRTGSARPPQEAGGEHRYVLAPAADTALGVDLTISQSEIRALQLAKGAIRAGIETLLAVHGLDAGRLDEIVIAGTFGTHLHVGSAVEIGLLPRIPLDRIHQVGNAAGVGAAMMLLSEDEREAGVELCRSITHVELSQQEGFRRRFAHAQWFPEETA
jgi:uncharacterized 2Fe-2S/4Fe-4S cluster protein (DUF4445 family)